MIKRISLLARKPGLTSEEFRRHWLGPHVAIVRQMPKLRGLELNVVSEGADESPWDGIGELWFDSMEDAGEAFDSEPVRSLLAADRPKFLGRQEAYWVVEHVVLPPPADRRG